MSVLCKPSWRGCRWANADGPQPLTPSPPLPGCCGRKGEATLAPRGGGVGSLNPSDTWDQNLPHGAGGPPSPKTHPAPWVGKGIPLAVVFGGPGGRAALGRTHVHSHSQMHTFCAPPPTPPRQPPRPTVHSPRPPIRGPPPAPRPAAGPPPPGAGSTPGAGELLPSAPAPAATARGWTPRHEEEPPRRGD